MKVKSRMSCPVQREDGTWTTVMLCYLSKSIKLAEHIHHY